MSESDQKSKQMIVYGHDFCSQSRMLTRVLRKTEVEYEYRDVINGKPVWKKELKKRARGNLSVPTVVFSDGTIMVEPWPEHVLDHLGLKDNGLVDRLTGIFGRRE